MTRVKMKSIIYTKENHAYILQLVRGSDPSHALMDCFIYGDFQVHNHEKMKDNFALIFLHWKKLSRFELFEISSGGTLIRFT